MKVFLQFFAPPLIGALIGFVTNVIAIKMLFRPLKEYRIFGIRIPFTPGILPRQRHKLAISIGSMVERELFTPEILRQRLAQDDVRIKFLESISRFTGNILESPAGKFFGEAADSDTEVLINALKDSVFRSPAAALFTQAVVKRICGEAGTRYTDAVSSLIGFLQQEDITKKLEIQGQRLITEILLGLNLLQRFLVSAGQYEKKIREQMPDIIAKLIKQAEAQLKSTDTRAKALAFFDNFIAKNAGSVMNSSEVLLLIKNAVLSGQPELPLGTLLAIDNACKQRLDDFLCTRLLRLAADEIESLLDSLDVRTLVSERIDSLDMLRVEHIILDIMANQLKWINLFGGILGFLIGFFQVLINFLTDKFMYLP